MRRLNFEPNDGDRRYIIVYQALCFADAQLARNELMVHGTLLQKMEGIGQIANPERSMDQAPLYRCVGGGEILVTEVEYAMVKRFLTKFLDTISRSLSRELNRAYEWIESVPEVPEATLANVPK